MEIDVRFPGGKRVDAQFNGFTVATDQPVEGGGQNSAPAPFDLFLASVATCAGIYVLGFCQARGLPTEGIGLKLREEKPEGASMPAALHLELTLPADFPEKYRSAVVRAAENCKVKKLIAAQPLIDVSVVGGASALQSAMVH